MLVAIGGLGVGPTATRLVAQRCESDPVELRSAVSLTIAISIAGGFTVALLVGIYAEPLCLLAFNDTSLAPLLRIGSFSIVLASMWNGLTGTLQGFLGFRSVACSQTAYGLVLLLGVPSGVRYFGEHGCDLGVRGSRCRGRIYCRNPHPWQAGWIGTAYPSSVGPTSSPNPMGFQCPSPCYRR